MLTARDAVKDRIAGLDVGADDYLTKPFAFGEFWREFRALLRRKDKQFVESLIEIGDLAIDTHSQRVWRNGQRDYANDQRIYGLGIFCTQRGSRHRTRGDLRTLLG